MTLDVGALSAGGLDTGPLGGAVPEGETDELAALDDDFSGTDGLEARGWSIYGASTIATQTIAGGELLLESTTGGSGAWWYSQPGFVQDGALIYKLVTGDFDARLRCRQRNAAGTGSPTGGVALEWRFAGLQVSGLDGNYAHIALGGSPNGANRIEWKVTDDDGAGGSQSTFDDVAGSATLDYDLRIERVGQILALSYRRSDLGEVLGSNVGWVELETIEKDSNTPPRTGGATPVAFPDELAVGIMPPYAGPQTDLDQQFTVEAFRIRRP